VIRVSVSVRASEGHDLHEVFIVVQLRGVVELKDA